jgi:SSS family solute:Na+ symporter
MTSALGAVAPATVLPAHRALPLVALAIGAALAARGQGIIDTMVSVNVVYIASVAVAFVALLSGRGMSASCAIGAMTAGFCASALAYAAGWAGLIDTGVDTVSLVAGLSASLLAVAAHLIRERLRPSPLAVPRA